MFNHLRNIVRSHFFSCIRRIISRILQTLFIKLDVEKLFYKIESIKLNLESEFDTLHFSNQIYKVELMQLNL